MISEQVIVYIDGFNLYYGAVKSTPYRWLDLDALCRQLLRPTDTLKAIKYYTALVSARPNNPSAPTRQQIYLRALNTIPHLSIYYGHFLAHPVRMPLVSSLQPGQQVQYVEVMKTEEKGSDVNLATHLLHDAHRNEFTLAVLVSNDSDLVEPMRIVRKELGKRVGVLNPQKQKHPSIELMKNADFVKNIRSGVLRMCQFPNILYDTHGAFRKPPEW
jgi:uncharacterized LabA/DUF88 family protein